MQDVLDLPPSFISEIILPLDFPPHRVVEAFVAATDSMIELGYLGVPADLHGTPLAEIMRAVPGCPDPQLAVVVVDCMFPASALIPILTDLRPRLERDGGRLVLIAGDGRGVWDPKPWDFASSHEGTRFYANMRYRVAEEFGSHGVDIIKDERHGRHGRRLWPRGTRGVGLRAEILDGDLDFEDPLLTFDDLLVDQDRR